MARDIGPDDDLDDTSDASGTLPWGTTPDTSGVWTAQLAAKSWMLALRMLEDAQHGRLIVQSFRVPPPNASLRLLLTLPDQTVLTLLGTSDVEPPAIVDGAKVLPRLRMCLTVPPAALDETRRLADAEQRGFPVESPGPAAAAAADERQYALHVRTRRKTTI